MIRMRKEVPEIGWGEVEVLDPRHDHVLALRYRWRGNSVVVLHNLSSESIQVELRLGDRSASRLVNLLTSAHSDADARGRHVIILEPYAYRWYRVGGLGYLLDRTAPDEPI